MSDKLVFKQFSFSDASELFPFVERSTFLCCDISIGFFAIWRDRLNIHYAIWNDTCVIRQNYAGLTVFSYPFGKDPDGMMQLVYDYALENNLSFRLFSVPAALLDGLKKYPFVKTVSSSYNITWSDYIYDCEDIMHFKGKKFNGQRNHINKFKRLYGEPVLKRIEGEDIPKILLMMEEYDLEHKDAKSMEKEEEETSKFLLKHLDDFALFGYCLFVGGRAVGFMIGEVIGEMLIIHVEKALRSYEGAYPTLFQSSVRAIKKRFENIKIINREDDGGDLGLRTSKQQYHPVGRVHKYMAFINSPLFYAKLTPIDCGGVFMSAMKETDKLAYYQLCTDEELNRLWGYDYKKDPSFPKEIDENTFYEVALNDKKAGESVSFALRTSLFEELIGEVIFWNIRGDRVEIGCRIVKEMQGRGYGKAAFRAAVSYAKNVLKLRPEAKCFIENVSSFKMISASGLKLTGQDETYYYFS